jgi:hypothetical protein
MQGVRGREHLPAPAPQEHMQGMRGRRHLPAPAPEEPMQGVRGREHLPAPAHQEHMQGVRGHEHLPAPAEEKPMQGVRGREHLPAPAPEEHMQGVRRGGGQVDAGWLGGARGSWRVSAAGYDSLMDGQFSCGFIHTSSSLKFYLVLTLSTCTSIFFFVSGTQLLVGHPMINKHAQSCYETENAMAPCGPGRTSYSRNFGY